MPKVRAKRRLRDQNRLFRFWLENLVKDARKKSLKVASTYEKALRSLQKYPLAINSAKECQILTGFGPTLCDLLESKLKTLSEAKFVSPTEALSYGNSLSNADLASLNSNNTIVILPSKFIPGPCSKSVKNEQVSLGSSSPHIKLPAFEPRAPISPVFTNTIPGDDFELILVIDNRETFGMNKLREAMQQSFSGVSINCEVRSLPVGDFVWIARLIGEVDKLTNEIVLGIVVERKRADDLASSIVDGRFLEQKSRMQRLGLRCIYVFEECSGMKNLRISYETLLQSLINAQVIDGCEVVNVSNGVQCLTYLASLSREIYSKSHRGLSVYHGGIRPKNVNQTCLWGIPWSEFVSVGNKSPTLPLREEFGRHLLQIHGMTGPKAEHILDMYPTPKSLFRAFDSLETLDSKKELLMKRSHSDKLRSINRNLSEFVYYQYNMK